MKFNIFGYTLTITKISKINKPVNVDYNGIRKLEMRNWIKYGCAPKLEDVDRYNKEVLGYK